jgi:hypothetical protein
MVATDLGYRADGCPDGARAVALEVRTLLAGLDGLADRLTSTRIGGSRGERPSDESLRRAAVDCLRRSGGDADATRGAMAVVVAAEWVQNLERVDADLEGPVDAAASAARTHWWR